MHSLVTQWNAQRLAVVTFAMMLALSTLLPWYTSQALVDFDVYRGNPLPLVDWVVAAMAALAAVLARARVPAGLLGGLSFGVTALMAAGEAAEGIEVRPGIGLLIALAASVGLLWRRTRSETTDDRSPGYHP